LLASGRSSMLPLLLPSLQLGDPLLFNRW